MAYENNVIFAAASGNNNNPFNVVNYPAGYDESWTFAVGATDESDQRAKWVQNIKESNYGPGLDFVAPGVTSLVYTTHIGQKSYGDFDGTSAATPHVAGLAALLRSANATLHVEDFQGINKASADKVGGYNYNSDGWHQEMGYGRINAGKALEIVNNWQIDHKTATGGTVVNITTTTMDFIDPGGGIPSGKYSVDRYEIRKTVSLPTGFVQIPGFDKKVYVWGRGINATTGWSQANPNHQVGWCNVMSYTETTAELQTFVYEVWEYPDGAFVGWYPVTPSNVVFAYTIAGATKERFSFFQALPALKIYVFCHHFSSGFHALAKFWNSSIPKSSLNLPLYLPHMPQRPDERVVNHKKKIENGRGSGRELRVEKTAAAADDAPIQRQF